MPETIQEPQEGDVAEHINGEVYRLVDVDGGATMVNLRSGEEYDVLRSELADMVNGDAWVIRRETEATVTDIDDLSEDGLYRYSHAEPGYKSRTFRVDTTWVDDDDFADYGEGCVTFHYRDGYVANPPTSNVERMIESYKIVRVE